MGACNYEVIKHGKDLKDAFKNAVEDALYYHGHDSYNGTISTTSLVGIDTDAPKFGTKTFYKYISKQYDTMNKWDCFAVELKGKALKEYRKQNRLERKKIKVYFFYCMAGC
jgi:hypothetical protein